MDKNICNFLRSGKVKRFTLIWRKKQLFCPKLWKKPLPLLSFEKYFVKPIYCKILCCAVCTNYKMISRKLFHNTVRIVPVEIFVVYSNWFDEKYVKLLGSKTFWTFSHIMAIFCEFCVQFDGKMSQNGRFWRFLR